MKIKAPLVDEVLDRVILIRIHHGPTENAAFSHELLKPQNKEHNHDF